MLTKKKKIIIKLTSFLEKMRRLSTDRYKIDYLNVTLKRQSSLETICMEISKRNQCHFYKISFPKPIS